MWELIIAEGDLKDSEKELIRVLLRRFDMSDIESAEAKKEAESNLKEQEQNYD